MDKMEQTLSMTVNSLPAKTWNWLHMNERNPRLGRKCLLPAR